MKGPGWVPLRGSAAFDAALRSRPVSRSTHFFLHRSPVDKLSTSCESAGQGPVDDFKVRLGMIVPKRFAKRSVTRTLIKRQIRAALQRHVGQLAAGDWVVRLRAPIDRAAFPSAASRALAVAMRAELDPLMDQGARARAAHRAPAEAASPAPSAGPNHA